MPLQPTWHLWSSTRSQWWTSHHHLASAPKSPEALSLPNAGTTPQWARCSHPLPYGPACVNLDTAVSVSLLTQQACLNRRSLSETLISHPTCWVINFVSLSGSHKVHLKPAKTGGGNGISARTKGAHLRARARTDRARTSHRLKR